MTTALWILALLILLTFSGFALVSIGEGERRAAMVSATIAFAGFVAFALGIFLPASFQTIILLTVMGGGVLALILFLLPVGRVDRLRDVPAKRFDERDPVLSLLDRYWHRLWPLYVCLSVFASG